MEPRYILIIKPVLTRPAGPNPTLTEKYFGEQHQWPEELQQWMNEAKCNPWPVYRTIITYQSMGRSGLWYHLPESGNAPDFVAFQDLDAGEVRAFHARWPEWFVEAVPFIPQDQAAELSMKVNPIDDS